MKSTTRNLLNHPCIFPVVLLFVGFFAYGLQLTSLGFYWDDWQAVYLSRAPVALLWGYFNFDRPFSAWTYALTFPVLGMSPLTWQIATWLIRWLAVLCLFFVLKRLWPVRIIQVWWICALIFIYPGFVSQPISVAFNQHFLTFLFYAFSLVCMVLAVKTNHRLLFWLWMLLSVATGLLSLFTMEYFIGLELIRPILLWILLKEPGKRVKQVTLRAFIYWLPFLMGLALFTYWRLALYPSFFAGSSDPNNPVLLAEIVHSPIDALTKITNHILQDGVYLLVQVWTDTIAPDTINLEARMTFIAWGVGALAALGFTWLAYRKDKVMADGEKIDDFYRQAFILGISILLLGGLPVWITDRQIILGKWSDRFTLAPLIGASILAVVLVDWLVQAKKHKLILLALLLGFSIAAQVRNTNKFRLDWQIQRDFYWQLFWRAPVLQPGTALFSQGLPSGLVSDYGTAFALNVLYSKDGLSPEAPYWFFTPRDEGFSFYKLAPGHSIEQVFRNIHFKGETDQAISVIYRPSTGCLRLLDPVYLLDPLVSKTDQKLVSISNPSQISGFLGASAPDPQIFGNEPARNQWCYYFQKADLARQQQDWNQVLSLLEESRQRGLKPRLGSEYLPFIEAYAQTGQWQKAYETSLLAKEVTKDLDNFLCDQWGRYAKTLRTPNSKGLISEAQKTFACE